jgi:glucose-6-phosphate 1-dehydrogenase
MTTQPTILILVGITGDLSKRKLLPAIDGLKEKGLLPDKFKLVGVTRRDDPALFKMDLDNKEDYLKLKDYLDSIEKEWFTSDVTPTTEAPQRLFYLSVAPTVSMPIITLLGESGLAGVPNTKLLLEKPFGTDLANGEELINDIDRHFSEESVYRIDHYLQKDSVRGLASSQMEIDTVQSIEVFASEKIGIEGRGDFYEQTGALRDFIQSHLLEVAAMMIDPAHRLEALKSFSVTMSKVKRAQYTGYREQVEKPDSVVETFVSVEIHMDTLKVLLKTGKALDKKSTDITVVYKDSATQVISLNDTHNAYENVFQDAMNSNKQFFVSKEEVLENWRIITPIQDAWAKDSSDLSFYEQGSSL